MCLEIAGDALPPNVAAGARYAETSMRTVNG